MLLLLLVRVRVSKPSQYSVVASNEFLAWPQPSSATQLVATSQHRVFGIHHHISPPVYAKLWSTARHIVEKEVERREYCYLQISQQQRKKKKKKSTSPGEQAVEEETTDAKICCLVFIDCAHIFLGSPKCIYMYRCCCKRSFCCCCWVQYLEL